MMMMMNTMMKIKMAIARSNFKLGAPDFACQQIQLLLIYDGNDTGDDVVDSDGNSDGNDEHDDEDYIGENWANFQARCFGLCILIDLDNTLMQKIMIVIMMMMKIKMDIAYMTMIIIFGIIPQVLSKFITTQNLRLLA